MNEREQNIVRTKTIGAKERIIVIAMLVSLFAALAVPVSQAAWNRELSLRLREIERNVSDLDEQQRLLEARLANLALPEVTFAEAEDIGLVLEKILFDQAKVVLVEERR